jgi:hypothetical protein
MKALRCRQRATELDVLYAAHDPSARLLAGTESAGKTSAVGVPITSSDFGWSAASRDIRLIVRLKVGLRPAIAHNRSIWFRISPAEGTVPAE